MKTFILLVFIGFGMAGLILFAAAVYTSILEGIENSKTKKKNVYPDDIYSNNKSFGKHKCDICGCTYEGESICNMYETVSSTVSIHHVGKPVGSGTQRYKLYHLCPDCIDRIETFIKCLIIENTPIDKR